MSILRKGLFLYCATALVALAFVVPATPQAPSDEDVALRGRALALNDVTGEVPMEGEIKDLIKDQADTKKLLKVAVRMAKEKEQPFNFNGAYILARAAQQLKDVDGSKIFYELCIQQGVKLQSESKIILGYSGMLSLVQDLSDDKKYEEGAKLGQGFLESLEKSGASAGVKAETVRRIIRPLTKMGKTEEAKKLLDTLPKDNWRNAELRAWFERELGHYAEAAKLYEEVANLIGKDQNIQDEGTKTLLQAETRYLLSGLYIEADMADKAIEQLRGLLASDPDNPTYNNDLGYVLADHDRNLDEAETMIRKALEKDRERRKQTPEAENKDTPAYLDSLGWVLYKKKKYPEAKKYLLEAIKDKEGQHVEILDHVGDVHLAMGEKAEAVAAWKKALTAEAPTKRDKERRVTIEKKIKMNQ